MTETDPEKRLIGYARVSTYGQTLDTELWAKVGDGLRGRRRRIVGVFAPPLLQQRSDTPCPMLPWSSCFNQGRLPTRSPRCCATERALLAQAIEAEVAEFLAKHADLRTTVGLRRVVR